MIAIEVLGNLDGDGYFTEEYSVVFDDLRLEGLDVSKKELESVSKMRA